MSAIEKLVNTLIESAVNYCFQVERGSPSSRQGLLWWGMPYYFPTHDGLNQEGGSRG